MAMGRAYRAPGRHPGRGGGVRCPSAATGALTRSASAASGSARPSGGCGWRRTTEAAAPRTTRSSPCWRIVNAGGSAISLSDLTLRYYFTSEGAAASGSVCYWAAVGCQNLQHQVTRLAEPADGADSVLEIRFGAGRGSLAPGASTASSSWPCTSPTGRPPTKRTITRTSRERPPLPLRNTWRSSMRAISSGAAARRALRRHRGPTGTAARAAAPMACSSRSSCREEWASLRRPSGGPRSSPWRTAWPSRPPPRTGRSRSPAWARARRTLGRGADRR
jgi:hypothetical protein